MSNERLGWFKALGRKIRGRIAENDHTSTNAEATRLCKDNSVWFSALIRRRRGLYCENELTIEHVAETPGYIARSLLSAKTEEQRDGRIRLQFPMQCAPSAMQKLRPDLNPGGTIQPEFTVRGPSAETGEVSL